MVSIIGIVGVAMFYTGNVKDRIKSIQVDNFANKIVSTAESVYYYGEPSKATVSVYLPDGVLNISIIENSLYIETQLSSGVEKEGFTSEVPLDGSINTNSGIKRIVITAGDNMVSINS